jgi:hypothetical protein
MVAIMDLAKLQALTEAQLVLAADCRPLVAP